MSANWARVSSVATCDWVRLFGGCPLVPISHTILHLAGRSLPFPSPGSFQGMLPNNYPKCWSCPIKKLSWILLPVSTKWFPRLSRLGKGIPEKAQYKILSLPLPPSYPHTHTPPHTPPLKLQGICTGSDKQCQPAKGHHLVSTRATRHAMSQPTFPSPAAPVEPITYRHTHPAPQHTTVLPSAFTGPTFRLKAPQLGEASVGREGLQETTASLFPTRSPPPEPLV